MTTMVDEVVTGASVATGGLTLDEPSALDGLRVLAAALDESQHPAVVRAAFVQYWADTLATRLRFDDHLRRHPAIADEPIVAPVFVIGMPRTGTTALVDLLALDPTARAPLQWETGQLLPPPEPGRWDTDPRIAATQAAFDAIKADPTSYAALGLHTHGALLPDECNSFLALDFWSPNFTAPVSLPRYDEWLALATRIEPYRLHRRILQHLQHHGPSGRWTLKSPFHALALDAVLAEYPDARFVQTHRDPAAFIPSLCGLISTIRCDPPGSEQRRQTGRDVVRLWGTCMQRCLASRRDPAIDARVVDVSHRELAADPVATVHDLYGRLGIEMTDEYDAIARQWALSPTQERSSVRFTLADFGLDEGGVREAFGPYCERFAAWF